MKVYEYKSRDTNLEYLGLDTEVGFISFYGNLNCYYLTLKSAEVVINITESFGEELGEREKKFITERGNQEVLCYICHRWEDDPDIFIFKDNNIAFTKECFKKLKE